jgi:phosphonate transport system substrate-binding protein
MYRRNVAVFGSVCVVLLLLSLIVTTSGCSLLSAAAKDPAKAGWPKQLTIGLIPGEDQEKVSARFGPLATYLEGKLGIPVKFFVGTDYSAVIEAMRNKHIDVGGFGPFSYVIAESRSGCEAFAVSLSKPGASPTYFSYIIAREDRGIKQLTDLKGKSFAFVDPASTSGHLFPRAMLCGELKITSDQLDKWFSSTRFSGGHDASFLAVLNGDVDGAAISSSQWTRGREAFKDHPALGAVKIVLESKPIPSSPTALRKDLPATLKQAIRDAYYNIANEPSLAQWRELHKILGGYVPIKDSDYAVIRDTAKALNLGPDELLTK